MSFAKSVFITGASRGIGREMVCQLLRMENGPKHIFAACRDPTLAKFQDRDCNSNLHIVKLDVTDCQEIRRVRDDVERVVGKEGLNLLINNAAFNCGRSLKEQDEKQLTKHFKTNSIAPLIMSQSFYGLLKRAAELNTECVQEELGIQRAAIVNLVSITGTFSYPVTRRNDSAFNYAYDSSKAALCMQTYCLAEEIRKDGIATVAMYPGWVNTDMGGCKAPLDVELSVSGILDTLRTKLNEKTSGRLLDYDGKELKY